MPWAPPKVESQGCSIWPSRTSKNNSSQTDTEGLDKWVRDLFYQCNLVRTSESCTMDPPSLPTRQATFDCFKFELRVEGGPTYPQAHPVWPVSATPSSAKSRHAARSTQGRPGTKHAARTHTWIICRYRIHQKEKRSPGCAGEQCRARVFGGSAPQGRIVKSERVLLEIPQRRLQLHAAD